MALASPPGPAPMMTTRFALDMVVRKLRSVLSRRWVEGFVW